MPTPTATASRPVVGTGLVLVAVALQSAGTVQGHDGFRVMVRVGDRLEL